jgi:hypothetical protein
MQNRYLNRIATFYHYRLRIGAIAVLLVSGVISVLQPQLQTNYTYITLSFLLLIGVGEAMVIHIKIDKLLQNSTQINYYSTGKDFDRYLKLRLRTAESLKIINISAEAIAAHPRKRAYKKIIHNYVKQNKPFSRIIANASPDSDLYKEMVSEVLKYHEQHKHSVHMLPSVHLDQGRLHGVMLIDDTEVCLGGSYRSQTQVNTICIQDIQIAKFYMDYYHTLLARSERITGSDSLPSSVVHL